MKCYVYFILCAYIIKLSIESWYYNHCCCGKCQSTFIFSGYLTSLPLIVDIIVEFLQVAGSTQRSMSDYILQASHWMLVKWTRLVLVGLISRCIFSFFLERYQPRSCTLRIHDAEAERKEQKYCISWTFKFLVLLGGMVN